MRFPNGSLGKESAETARDAGDTGSIPESGRSPGREHDNPLQYSCLENPLGQRIMVGYTWDCKELDMTEWLSTKEEQLLVNSTEILRKDFDWPSLDCESLNQ